MKRIKHFSCACVMLAMTIRLAVPALAAEVPEGQKIVTAVADYLETKENRLLLEDELTPGESVSDWIAFSLGRSGSDDGAEQYLKKMEEEVTRRYREEGGLSENKATEWQRISLTIMALGGDPTAFGEDADGRPIDLVKEGTYGWDRADGFDVQGLNAWIFALLTLDAREFEVPPDAKQTRETILEHILKSQDESGGFGLSGGASVDITAMALQALAPYKDEEARDAVARALDYLSRAQGMQGSFGDSAESTAQVVIALCCLGIDPETDARFCKEGGSLLDGLRMFRLSSGLYCHQMGEEENMFATKEALLAFVAADRFHGGYRSLYDMRPEEDGKPERLYVYKETGAVSRYWIILPAAAAAAVIIGICVKKGKKKRDV